MNIKNFLINVFVMKSLVLGFINLDILMTHSVIIGVLEVVEVFLSPLDQER